MRADSAEVASRFHAIATRILNAKELPVDPWLYRYCGSNSNLASAERYVRHQVDLLELAGRDVQGAVVVDVGCGFGFAMIVHVLLGARSVHGIELYPGMVSTVEAYLPIIAPEVCSRMTIVRASAAAVPFDDGSADILLSIEAISHYLDVDAFIDEAWRVLRPGGVLIIADGNNATNPKLRQRAEDLWEAFESGPEGREVHGHLVGVPYAARRRQVLGEHFPTLSEQARNDLASHTAGFTDDQVLAAARAYVAKGVLPDATYRRGQLAIAPDGQAMERLFAPHELARTLQRRGFRAKAYGYWGGASGSAGIRMANRTLAALSPLTMRFSRSFRVIAHKPA